jgi:predicted RND superfamily exporter protein
MLKDTLLKWLKLDGIVRHFTGYIEAQLELFKYEIHENIASGLARVLVLLTVLMISSMVVLMGSVSLAFKLSEYVGYSTGFALTAAGYALIVILLVIFRKPITNFLEAQVKSNLHKK